MASPRCLQQIAADSAAAAAEGRIADFVYSTTPGDAGWREWELKSLTERIRRELLDWFQVTQTEPGVFRAMVRDTDDGLFFGYGATVSRAIGMARMVRDFGYLNEGVAS